MIGVRSSFRSGAVMVIAWTAVVAGKPPGADPVTRITPWQTRTTIGIPSIWSEDGRAWVFRNRSGLLTCRSGRTTRITVHDLPDTRNPRFSPSATLEPTGLMRPVRLRTTRGDKIK